MYAVQISYLDVNCLSLSDFDKFQSLLSVEESAKANKFRFQKDKNRYITGHGYLRVLLGSYLNCDPAALKFGANPYGKPFLRKRDISDSIYFNVSDSDDYVVYAFSRVGEIGIDIEKILPDFATQEVAKRFFSDHEVSALRSLPEKDKIEAFFNCWTRKEAFIKAIGEGLSYPLKDFDVSLKPGEPAKLLRIRGDAEEASQWTIQEMPIAAGYKASFAIRAKDFEKYYRGRLMARPQCHQAANPSKEFGIAGLRLGYLLTENKPLKEMIKDCSNKKPFENENYVRISVKTKEDNKKLIDALKQIELEK